MVIRLSSMEHEDLIREMSLIEKLSTQERLKLAKKRRKEQLRRFYSREKDWSTKRSKSAENRSQQRRLTLSGRVHFVDSVMLLEAAARNDIDEVRRLLEMGVNPDSTNEDGLTALHQCCIDDSEEMMTLLLDHGANVDAEDSERWTPLHAAATCGHLHLVKHLVERGANLLAVNADGNMAYDICEDDTTLEYIETQMARRGVTQELIEQTRGQTEAAMLEDLKQRPLSRLEERVQQAATPLHIAAANGYMSVVEYLLENHVSVDARDQDDWQPVHAAACWGHPQVIEVLYQHGADLSAKTRNGETPFDVCEDPEIRDRLEQLRTEQELRRTEQQRPRVRRTQSTKHSIRRTSMREKTLTPKKDVKEEARIRLSVDGTISALRDSNRSLDSAGVLGLEDISVQLTDNVEKVSSPAEKSEDAVDAGQAAPVQDQNGATELRKRNGHQINNNDDTIRDGKKHSLESAASSVESAGKIDIHVHVTVNTGTSGGGSGAGEGGAPPPYHPPAYTATYSHAAPQGTLADLKKQRAQSRSLTGAAFSLSPLPTGAAGGAPPPGHAVTSPGQPAGSSPPVPRRRFISASEDCVTSEPPKERTGCCSVQ